MKKVMLDTNAYASFFAGDKAVLDVLAQAETVYMPVIVIGELYAGFRGGRKETDNRAKLAVFLKKSTVHVLNVTQETAQCFGEIKDRLKKAGTPIPINDVWIAAQALETGSVLITYDAHFAKVQGLRLWEHML